MAIVSSNAASQRPRPDRVPDRVVDGARQEGDDVDLARAGVKEDSLRPKRLADYIGQRELKQVLGIAVQAAVGRGEALDHVLLYGPPGLGKTTMAMVLAEELLYPAMEDRRLDLTVGKGSTARTRALDLPPFTLVGATTRAGALSSPLRDRFGLIQRLEFYGLEDLQAIVERAAGLLNLELSEAACTEIARRCRGTPRIANRLLRRVRDVACVRACEGCIDQHLVDEALTLHRVDGRGLDASDRRLMELLLQSHGGGPAGLDTLAAALGEDPSTLESVVEPYLLQLGFLQRTPRGRVVTAAGRGHLGWPEGQEQVA